MVQQQSIKQIKASTRRLEDSRNEVVQAVGELSRIAEENVESTKKTYDGTQEVVGTFQQVYVSAEQLRGADWLKFDMGQVYVMITFSILPVIIVYLILSKHIVQGVALGSVKG